MESQNFQLQSQFPTNSEIFCTSEVSREIVINADSQALTKEFLLRDMRLGSGIRFVFLLD